MALYKVTVKTDTETTTKEIIADTLVDACERARRLCEGTVVKVERWSNLTQNWRPHTIGRKV